MSGPFLFPRLYTFQNILYFIIILLLTKFSGAKRTASSAEYALNSAPVRYPAAVKGHLRAARGNCKAESRSVALGVVFVRFRKKFGNIRAAKAVSGSGKTAHRHTRRLSHRHLRECRELSPKRSRLFLHTFLPPFQAQEKVFHDFFPGFPKCFPQALHNALCETQVRRK